MAKAEFTIGEATYNIINRTLYRLRWRLSQGFHILPPTFFADSTEPETDRDIRELILISGFAPANITIRFGDETRTSSGDLSDTAEASSKLITLQAPGWGPYTMVGPQNSQTSEKDSTEPYAWFDSNYSTVQMRDLILAYTRLSSNTKRQTVLIVDDGAVKEIPGIDSIYLGATAISKVYLGNTLIYED